MAYWTIKLPGTYNQLKSCIKGINKIRLYKNAQSYWHVFWAVSPKREGEFSIHIILVTYNFSITIDQLSNYWTTPCLCTPLSNHLHHLIWLEIASPASILILSEFHLKYI